LVSSRRQISRCTFACGSGTFGDPVGVAGLPKRSPVGADEKAIEAARASRFESTSRQTIDRIHLGPNRGAWFKDPDGNIFALVERGSP
jgi:hypothetical protein